MNFKKITAFIECLSFDLIIEYLLIVENHFCSQNIHFAAHFATPCAMPPGVAVPLTLLPATCMVYVIYDSYY